MGGPAAAAVDSKAELLRVRRDLAAVEEQLERVGRDCDAAAELGDGAKVEDLRAVRKALWGDKEQLRQQETIFLKAIYPALTPLGPLAGAGGPPPPPPPPGFASFPLLHQPQPQGHLGQLSMKPVRLAKRAKSGSSPPVPSPRGGGGGNGGGYSDFANPGGGYEVNRSADCKVVDVWKEWKEGLGGNPSVEKLEQARKSDRKLVWWRHKNDYKYWSKQMRIIHAIEQKMGELGGDINAAIHFWEDILKNEFEGSISKLREALGGVKAGSGGSGGGASATGDGRGDMGGLGEMSEYKRQRKALLQQGLERLQAGLQTELPVEGSLPPPVSLEHGIGKGNVYAGSLPQELPAGLQEAPG
eukprot:SM000005S17332  [mRNA]  locus=s5:1444006:1445779:- [translate_table: standard]